MLVEKAREEVQRQQKVWNKTSPIIESCGGEAKIPKKKNMQENDGKTHNT